MTQNQIAFKRAEEEERANLAKEAETKRHNRHMEASEYLKSVFGKGGIMGQTGNPIFRAVANHPEWYSQFPELVKDVANFAFSRPLGQPFTLPTIALAALHAQFNYVPYVGTLTGTDADPATIAAVGIFAKIRERISGSRPYDRNDVMQVLLATSNIYARLVEAMRAIKSLNMSDFANQAVTSLGNVLLGNPNYYADAVKEKANYVARINTIVSKLSNLPMPTNIPYFIRHMWLSAHVFADSDQPKFRIITYACEGRITYKWRDSTLEIYSSKLADVGMADWLDGIETDLNVLLDSEDVAIILGDIRRAYEGQLASLAPLDIHDTIEFVYSEEVLSQLESGRLHGELLGTYTVEQDGQNLRYGSVPEFKAVYSTEGTVLSTALNGEYALHINKCNYIDYNNIEDNTPELNMVASRFMTNVNIDTEQAEFGPIFTIKSAGSEILTTAVVYYRTSSGVGNLGYITVYPVNAVPFANYTQYVYLINQMNYLPKIGLKYMDTTETNYPITIINFRPHYIALIPEESVALMNNVAILSELAIASTPEVGYSGSSKRSRNSSK